MPLAEVADGSEVRRIQRHYHHKIVPFAASSCDPPRRIQPTRIAVQQKRHHHPRVKRRLPEPAHIAARDLLEIEALPHQLDDKPRDMAFWNEVLHIRRQKQRLIDIPRAKILAHGPTLNQTRPELKSDYPDRLLASVDGGNSSRKTAPALGASAGAVVGMCALAWHSHDCIIPDPGRPFPLLSWA